MIDGSLVPLRNAGSGGSRGGNRGTQASPLLWVKKEEMTTGRKAGWASKIEPGPLLSSKSLDPPLSGSVVVIQICFYSSCGSENIRLYYKLRK